MCALQNYRALSGAMMAVPEIHLARRELTSSASASPGCMVVYPLGKKSRQRVGVSDKSGAMSVFCMGKTMERVAVFETPAPKKPVSCATLYEDQLFVVCGSVLEAYSRKGKLFFGFDTNVTEAIHSIFVSTPFIISCGTFMVTGFQEAKELGFYMAPDRINTMVAFVANDAVNRQERTFDDYCCVLGCNDRMIRMLRSHQLVEEVRCEAPLSALCASDTSCKVYYGTAAGSLGCLGLKDGGHSFFREFGHIPDERLAAVTALALYDVNMDGQKELMVGRRDGSVHVFCICSEEGENNSCLLCIWSGNADASVLSIAGGLVMHNRLPDVLVHSLNGRITAFSLKEDDHARVEEAGPAQTTTANAEAQMKEVRTEIETLRRTLVAKTEELTGCIGASKADASMPAIFSSFTANVSLSQQGNSPALVLVVDADTPMSCVALQSEVHLSFLEIESGKVIVQETIPRKNPSTKTLAIVRPLETHKYSCSVAFWVEDGHWGLLKVISFASPVPRTAQVKLLQVRPLSLYARVGGVHKKTAVEETPPALSVMEVSGNFSARDMHSWLFRMLPGTPEIYQQKMSTLLYEDAFFHYTFQVEYGDGSAVFTSESLSALTVTKRFIGYCAAERSLEVKFRAEVHSDAVRTNLRRIVPHIVACSKTAHEARLLETLQTLQLGEGEEADCLSREHRRLLEGAEQVKQKDAQTATRLEYLQKLLVGLYDSASEFLPNIPRANRSVKEVLGNVGAYSDASELMKALECIFLL